MGPNRVLELTGGTQGKRLIFKVDRTWVHLPGSREREKTGSGQTFFLKIDHRDLGTCNGTKQGTWTRRMSTAEMLAGTGSAYHVHREEDLALVKLFSIFF